MSRGRKSFENSKRDKFLAALPTENCEDDMCTLAKKCKFNFSYLTVVEGSYALGECDLVELINKLQEFSREPISLWETRDVGHKGGKIFVYYGKYPAHTTFPYPKSVPANVDWGRFRLNDSFRLVGFSIPEELDGKEHPKLGFRFERNTFYCVFLDKDHKFWP